MKTGAILLSLFMIMQQALHAQTGMLTNTQQDDVNKLIRAAKAGNKQQIASLVAYPLKRTYPLEDIKSNDEMLMRFDTIFDPVLLRQIARSKTENWKAMGWRGLMLDNGVLWMDDAGKIIAINHQSEKEKKLQEKAIQKDKKKLPPSLQGFVKPLYNITTERFRIRIDELAGDRLRYASWSRKRGNKEPDLVLYNGIFEAQGSGGNHTITFTNGQHRYVVTINRLGTSETPEVLLTVFKEGKELLNDPGRIKRN
ncbi:hypothetical protein [Niabella aurantiaca]|uniref:hypothetical protein n=1 Tax=Niabella aurantiaca TaxID=379900 RepID=UPI0012FC159F|nr:hypothetical protein [Niabella aurantiaca]